MFVMRLYTMVSYFKQCSLSSNSIVNNIVVDRLRIQRKNYVNISVLLPLRSTVFIQLSKGPISEFFIILFTLCSRKMKEFGGIKNNCMAFVKLKKKKNLAYSDPLLLISLDYFNGPHSLKLKITLWHRNDYKYFPEKPKMTIHSSYIPLIVNRRKASEF